MLNLNRRSIDGRILAFGRIFFRSVGVIIDTQVGAALPSGGCSFLT
jgi:hypothetical protein